MILGFVDVVLELRRLVRRINFTVEYRERWFAFFQDYRQDRGKPEDYGWLTENLAAITIELGPENRIIYRAPLGAFIHSSYPLLDNTLADVRMQRADVAQFELADHNLIAHGGALRHRVEMLQPILTNPLTLLIHGLRFVLSLPLLLLGWFGLLPPASVQNARGSWVFRLFQLVASIAAAGVAIEGVVDGWPAFISHLQGWFSWIP